MEIRNLITFVVVAELNSFTKAAKALDYSQSTVSFQIKQLETELGCMLFERINHTLVLTEKGRELLVYANGIRRLTEELRENMAGRHEIQGHVHIVAPDSVCTAMINDNYRDFHRRYPGITLKFSTAETDDMFRILDHNEADVMLTLDSHVYQRDYIIAKEARMPAHFVVGAASPLAGRRGMSVDDIADADFILTEKGVSYRRVLDETLAQRSIQLQPVLEMGRTDVITSLLEMEDAVSFLPDFITRQKVAEGRLVHLDVTDVQVEIWQQLIYHRSKWISKSLEAFIEYVKEHEFGR